MFRIWYIVLETQKLARGTLHLVPGICQLGTSFVLDTYNLAPGIWHVLGICQLGISLSWRRLLWHHLAFPVAAACTCLIAANWRGIARILLHRLLCIITLRGIARILLQIGRCALRGGEHQLCAVVAFFVLVQQCTM